MKTLESLLNSASRRVAGWLHLFGRRLTRGLWLPEIEAAEADVMLKELHATEGGMEVHIKQNPHKAQWVAQCFAELVATSPNYTEMRFDTKAIKKNGVEWITVTVQKGSGKTPHELRRQAEMQLAQYRYMIEKTPTK